MQTSFYVSGFLYSLKTHQLLLLDESKQKDDASSLWSMLGGESKNEEEAQTAFQRIMNKLLNINLKEKNIYPVYDYFHNTKNKLHYVFYVEVRSTKSFNGLRGGDLSWFTFGEALKLPVAAQTKQDIVVGERVINAKWRDDEAKKAFNSIKLLG